MANDDLDKYLEGLGIDVDDEAGDGADPSPPAPSSLSPEPPEPTAPGARAEALAAGAGAADVVDVVRESADPRDRTESFLVHLLLNFDPAYAVEVRTDDEGEVHAEVFGGDAGRIIGRGGRTLAALEYLANAVVNRGDVPPVRVSVDAGGYKRRRDERLRQTARQAAERARNEGRVVELDAMSAAERRIVHMELAEDPSVRTESAGEGRDRRVVVHPK